MRESDKSEINLVVLSGYVGGKPDYWTDENNGKTILRFPLASKKLKKNKVGDFYSLKQYFTIMGYDKVADMCKNNKLAMGMQIVITGKLDQYVKPDEDKSEQSQGIYYHINLQSYKVMDTTQAIYNESPKKHLAARDEQAIGYNADVADLTIKGKDFNPLAD